ncbi:RAMP superfamily CRISPR-associated protein [Paenibacillus sp. FSL H8-0104]|uniref:RAMP superfamily CRISPR-associated protein n=1 Tax=Paenibacillus sp. FSL H8-0104 TaxID=2954509 RepID=UPI0030FDC8C8
MENSNEYVLELRLLSEAVFASGEKERNLVQSRVLSDEYGFVYFHAKSLKGQLKRQALWLLRQYIAIDRKDDYAHAYAFLHSMDVLFGVNTWELVNAWDLEKFMNDYLQHEQSGKGLRGQGIMRFTHLELPHEVKNAFRELIDTNAFSSHDLTSAQTYLRTEIQLEEGIVKDNMLNTYQAVKKGLVFQSRIFFEENPSEVLPDLLRIIYSLDRIGAGVHRGRGEIETKLLIDGIDAQQVLHLGGRGTA